MLILFIMHVTLCAALSADGFIAQHVSERAFDWTSREDRHFFIEKSREAGVIVMGLNTYRTFRIKRAPPGRRLIILTKEPSAVSGDGVETANEPVPALVKRLESEGVKRLILGGGASIYTQFLEAGLVDDIFLTVEPVFFGAGIPLFTDVSAAGRLQLIGSQMLSSQTIVLHYRLDRLAGNTE